MTKPGKYNNINRNLLDDAEKFTYSFEYLLKYWTNQSLPNFRVSTHVSGMIYLTFALQLPKGCYYGNQLIWKTLHRLSICLLHCIIYHL